MTTARQIITKAMQKAKILSKSETPDGAEMADALEDLNNLVDSWSNDSITSFSRTIESFPLTANVASYTIGSGQTFDTTLPTNISSAHVTRNGFDYKMVFVSDGVYNNSILNKDIQGIPELLNYDNASPIGTINVFPKPTSGYTITLISEKAISSFATLDLEITLQKGLKRALIYNLAIEISPEYGENVDANLRNIAKKSLGSLRRTNLKYRTMNYPNVSGMSNNNIISGFNN